jgi:hypothetical protein
VATDDDLARYRASWYTDAALRTSAERKANPLPFALEALEDLFHYADDEEGGFGRFRSKLESGVPWSEDAVECLERVLADPPPDLGRLVREQAGVVVWTEGPHGDTRGDDAAHEAWLRRAVPRLRAMLDRYIAEHAAAEAGS